MSIEEKDRVEKIAINSKYAYGVNSETIKYSFEILKRFYNNGKILELGPAEGVMTKELVKLTNDLTVVDGSEIFVESLKEKYKNIKAYTCLFEDFKTDEKYDLIVLGQVLEHVINPVEILKLVRNWLAPEGIVFAAVPNCNSIHRQAAVIMKLQDKENSMSEQDIYHGHRRVYNPKEFKQDFIDAGLNIKKSGGYWLKPVSNKQIEETWTNEMIDAFMKLGEKYPDIAAETYVVAGI